jgi:hypothetical protein
MRSLYLSAFKGRRSSSRGPRGRARFGFLAACLLAFSGIASAQTMDIGNEFIKLHCDPTQGAGRIWIQGGPSGPNTDFLFHGGFITSNLVFRVGGSGGYTYYCNVPNNFNWRPYGPGMAQPIPFRAYDSVYRATDTLALVYKNLSGYNITVRYVVEPPTSIYDRGSDILMEFSYDLVPFAPGGELGIYMMLDCYNSDAQGGGGQGDRSSVITDQGYFPYDNYGKKFAAPFDSIPQFYHVGNFRYSTPLNTVFPIHRLRGYSHSGAPLTTPEMFAIGGWPNLRNIGWDPTADVGAQQIGDVATAVRWSGLYGSGTVRTAFGLNDEAGNNMFICRDDKLFMDIHTVRVVKQAVKNGPYSPAQFDVEMWISNLSDVTPIAPYIRLTTPIRSLPNLSGRLTLDPSTPAVQPVNLSPKATKKLVWRLNVNPGSTDTLAQLSFDYQTDPSLPFKQLAGGCTPMININGKQDNPPPPPQDTVPPVIQFNGPSPTRSSAALWNFSVFDRHPGYDYDSGLDKVIVWSNDGNFTFKTTPSVFRQCDKSVTVDVTTQVIDVTKPGKIVFAAFDCKGNRTLDSAFYIPVVDEFVPEVVHIDSLDSFGPGCNTRIYVVSVVDSTHKDQFRQDFGFGSIDFAAPPVNFAPLEINPFRATPTIFPFDKSADFRLRVIDSMVDGDASVKVTDYAGNSIVLPFHYCTLPDVKAPVGVVTPVATPVTYAREWTVDASDTLAWDRGLKDVVRLSPADPNFVFTPPSITPGARTTTFTVGLVNDALDGSITLEIRDLQYATTPVGHADTITIRFNRMPDERAPNIIFAPVPGKNGSEADVEVNDIHYDGSTLYKYDLGLKTVDVMSVTPNIQVSPISFSGGDMRTTFHVKVLDTLVLNPKDSVCIEAIDLAGNRSTGCFFYPVRPDTTAPIFVGQVMPGFSAIVGTATDDRSYDRGLGAISIQNGVNIDPSFSMPNLYGSNTVQVNVNVPDPTKPISGTLVIQDRIATLDPSPATQAIHTVKLPFYIPAVGISVKMPLIVEGNTEFTAAIVTTSNLPTTATDGGVDQLAFQAEYSNNVEYRGPIDGKAQFTVVPGVGQDLDIQARLDPLKTYNPGDTLGLLRFFPKKENEVYRLDLHLADGSAKVNGGGGRVITYRAPGDTATSMLQLPAPTFKLAAGDSVTFVNGICGRILTTSGSSSKLAVLGVLPQPARPAAGQTVNIDVRNLPVTGARAELVSATGETVAQFDLTSTGDRVTRVPLPLPSNITSGVYQLRITAETGTDVVKLVIGN